MGACRFSQKKATGAWLPSDVETPNFQSWISWSWFFRSTIVKSVLHPHYLGNKFAFFPNHLHIKFKQFIGFKYLPTYNSLALAAPCFLSLIGKSWRRMKRCGWPFGVFRWCGEKRQGSEFSNIPPVPFLREFLGMPLLHGVCWGSLRWVPFSKSACFPFLWGAKNTDSCGNLMDVPQKSHLGAVETCSQQQICCATRLVMSCWGGCSITRSSPATGKGLATSALLSGMVSWAQGSQRKRCFFSRSAKQLNETQNDGFWWITWIYLMLGLLIEVVEFPHFPWTNRRTAVGILKTPGSNWTWEESSHRWCVLGCFFEFSPLQRYRFQLVVKRFFAKNSHEAEVSEAVALPCGGDGVSRCPRSSDMFVLITCLELNPKIILRYPQRSLKYHTCLHHQVFIVSVTPFFLKNLGATFGRNRTELGWLKLALLGTIVGGAGALGHGGKPCRIQSWEMMSRWVGFVWDPGSLKNVPPRNLR